MEKCDTTYNIICRVCLKQSTDKNMVSLSEKPDRRGSITYEKVLMRIARISIEYDNFLPTKICQNCKQMVQDINSFAVMCKINNKKLRKFVNMSQNNKEKCSMMIWEYTLFCQYFSSKDFKNTPVSTNVNDFQEQICKIKSMNEDCPPVCIKSDLNKMSSSNDYDSEYFNDSILDNNQNESSNESNADLVLDSIEKAVNTDKKCRVSVKTQQKSTNNTENIDTLLDSIEKAVNADKQCRVSVNTQQKSTNNTENIDTLLDSIEKAVNTRVKHNNMKNHRKLVEKKFHCDICNHTLASRFTYNYHMQRHTKYNYICDQCGRGFPGLEPLNRHLVKNHNRGLSLLCSNCPFKCSKRFELVEHIRIHTGERPFTCDKCGLTFRRKAIWRNHLIKHKEKLISCNICQKKFHRQSDLVSHLNSVHERMFLYLCGICDTTFAKGGSVRKHMLAKHGIPRDKQGKVKRVTKESNRVLFMENRSDGFPVA